MGSYRTCPSSVKRSPASWESPWSRHNLAGSGDKPRGCSAAEVPPVFADRRGRAILPAAGLLDLLETAGCKASTQTSKFSSQHVVENSNAFLKFRDRNMLLIAVHRPSRR